jgi:hypothetical protein
MMEETHIPLQITEGMVLQRNWNLFPSEQWGHKNLVCGEYLRIRKIQDNGWADMHIISSVGLYIGFPLEEITDEWFIPD